MFWGSRSSDPRRRRRRFREGADELLERRAAARAARDFAASDALRDELAAMGVEVRDTADGQETLVPRKVERDRGVSPG